jgi:hypothetical protein
MLYVLAFFENKKFCFVVSLFSIEEIVFFSEFFEFTDFSEFFVLKRQ